MKSVTSTQCSSSLYLAYYSHVITVSVVNFFWSPNVYIPVGDCKFTEEHGCYIVVTLTCSGQPLERDHSRRLGPRLSIYLDWQRHEHLNRDREEEGKGEEKEGGGGEGGARGEGEGEGRRREGVWAKICISGREEMEGEMGERTECITL